MISIRSFVPQDHSIGGRSLVECREEPVDNSLVECREEPVDNSLVECREERAVYRDHRGHAHA